MTRDFKSKKCGNCVFFDGATGTAISVGICRRFPPLIKSPRGRFPDYPERGGGSPACAEWDLED